MTRNSRSSRCLLVLGIGIFIALILWNKPIFHDGSVHAQNKGKQNLESRRHRFWRLPGSNAKEWFNNAPSMPMDLYGNALINAHLNAKLKASLNGNLAGATSNEQYNFDNLEQTAGRVNNSDQWLMKPEIFYNLSQSAQRYLINKYLPQTRSWRRGAASAKVKDPALNPAALADGDNIRVNDPSRDGLDRTQSETSAVTMGNTILVSFNDSAGLAANNLSGLSISTDGGKSWRQDRLPSAGGINLGDGVVGADLRGILYYAQISINNKDLSQVTVSRSMDGGKTWKHPIDGSTTANKDNGFQDKEWMAVDRAPDSRFKNRVYLSWTSFLPNGRVQIMFARSRNNGRTFMPAHALGESNRFGGTVQGSMIATGPKGEIYVVWSDSSPDGIFGNTDLRLTRSLDGGRTFSAPIILTSFTNPAFPANGVFSGNTFPSIAVDNSNSASRGNVYVVYSTRGTDPDRSNVTLISSSDSGNTWSAPRKLNDDNSFADQLLPSVAVADDGAVAATWYDRRNDVTNLSLLDIYATVSLDGGQTFAPNQRITTANWPLIPTPFNLRGGYHGDYHQLTTQGNRFLFNWGDDRSGNDSDVYIALKRGAELASAKPDMVLTSQTALQTIQPGSTATFVIDSVSVNGADTTNIDYQASPKVDGLSYSFIPGGPVPGKTTLLQVQAAATLPAGPYHITVTGTKNNLTRSTAVRLAVIDSPDVAILPQNITNNPTNSQFPVSFIDNSGNINVAWLDDQPGIASIFFTRSTDGGKNFSTPVLIPRNKSFIGTPIVMATEREIYIAYLELFDTPRVVLRTMITRSIDGGKTFEPAQVVTTDDKIFAVPESFQLDSDGTVHFGVMTLTPPDQQNPVFTNFDASSKDGGKSFKFNAIYQSSSPLSQPIISLEGDGKTERVIMLDQKAQNGGLLLLRSTDGGQTFGSPTTILADISDLLFAGGFFADNNQTHIVFASGNFNREEFNLFYTRTGTDGNFTAPIQIKSDARTILGISLATDNTGNLVVAFEGSFNNFSAPDYLSRIFYCNSINGGQSFSSVKTFEPQRGGDFSPQVILNGLGNYSIIYNGFNKDDQLDVFYTASPAQGQNFPAPKNVSANAGITIFNDLSFDTDGALQILYQDNSPGSFDILRIKFKP